MSELLYHNGFPTTGGWVAILVIVCCLIAGVWDWIETRR